MHRGQPQLWPVLLPLLPQVEVLLLAPPQALAPVSPLVLALLLLLPRALALVLMQGLP